MSENAHNRMGNGEDRVLNQRQSEGQSWRPIRYLAIGTSSRGRSA